MLAAHIQLAGQKSKQRVLVLTGAGSRQGTSLTVANLGSALAEQGRNVLIVDGNGRNPSMHRIFQLSNEVGLVDIVSGKVDMKDVIQKTEQENLSLIALGSESAEPFSIRDSSTEPLIKLLRQKFDFVLLDAPALSFADISSLAEFADEIIMVARRSHIKRDSLKSAGEFISKFTDKQLGLIINESEVRSFSS